MEGLEFCFIPVDCQIIFGLPFCNQNKFPQSTLKIIPLQGFLLNVLGTLDNGCLYSASQTWLHFLSTASSALSFLPELLSPMSNVPSVLGTLAVLGSLPHLPLHEINTLTEFGEIPYLPLSLQLDFTVISQTNTSKQS